MEIKEFIVDGHPIWHIYPFGPNHRARRLSIIINPRAPQSITIQPSKLINPMDWADWSALEKAMGEAQRIAQGFVVKPIRGKTLQLSPLHNVQDPSFETVIQRIFCATTESIVSCEEFLSIVMQRDLFGLHDIELEGYSPESVNGQRLLKRPARNYDVLRSFFNLDGFPLTLKELSEKHKVARQTIITDLSNISQTLQANADYFAKG